MGEATAAHPAVSIVLPTFNRGDVIRRAVDSVRRQTFEDWELVVVDDGSTDGTGDLLSGLDPRLVFVRQENAGVYAARNTGLARARGRWITFLDSDDEWLPHYLELTTAFLAHHPEAAFVTTEFWQDWGAGPVIKHDHYEVAEKYPRLAKAVGSNLFALPAGETDDYLRVYAAREPIGAWGSDILARAGIAGASWYRGHIFSHMRFGYLNWLPTTMLTRRALEAVGPFTTRTRSSADYRFLCRLARLYTANMIAVPSATKLERATAGRSLSQDHLATGLGAFQFAINLLGYFDELYTRPMHGDPEIQLLRKHHCLSAGRAALALGMRDEALALLREAAAPRANLWRAYPGLALAAAVPSDRLVGKGYRAGQRVAHLAAELLSGRLTPARIALRLRRGARPRPD